MHPAIYRLRIAGKASVLRMPRAMGDFVRNRRLATQRRRFLIVRHPAKPAYVYNHFLEWLESAVPQVRSHFEMRLLPCAIRDWSPYVLHAAWIGDTSAQWSPRAFRQAEKILAVCDRRGLPVINRLDRLPNATKLEAARRIASAGIRTPRMVHIDDPQSFRRDPGGLLFPLLVREDEGHGQPTFLVANASQLEDVPLAQFRNPIAAEFIDVRSPHDGLYRKYRYLAFGDSGVPRHLIINDHWEVRPKRRIMNDAVRNEEIEYVNHADPHHDQLQCARRALGLDIVGFDYSYDQDGQLVIWEANPYPDLRYPKNPWTAHIGPAVRLSFAALARLFLVRAGLEVPDNLQRHLAAEAFSIGNSAASARQTQRLVAA